MVWKKIRLDPEEIYAKIPDIKEGDILQIEIPRHASKLVPADRIYVRVDRRIPGSSAALRWFLGWTRENAIRGTLIDKNGTEYVPVVIKTHFAPVPDDIRRLLLAGVELFSVEKKIGGREKTPFSSYRGSDTGQRKNGIYRRRCAQIRRSEERGGCTHHLWKVRHCKNIGRCCPRSHTIEHMVATTGKIARHICT